MEEAASMYPEAHASYFEESPHTPPTVHEAARAIDPEVFGPYDKVSARLDTYKRWYNEATDAHRAELEASAPKAPVAEEVAASAPHTAEIADLEAKLKSNPGNAKQRARKEEALAKLRAERDAHISSTTETMQAARDDFIDEGMANRNPTRQHYANLIAKEFQEKMALSSRVQRAYRKAEKRMPKTAEDLDAAYEDAWPDLAEPSPDAAPMEAALAPEAAPAAAPPSAIRDRVTKDLVTAGRPAEEASAASEIIARYYERRAERFDGKRGTAEEMFLQDAPRIAAGRGEGKTAKGKWNDLKRTVTLFKTADASTFLHETGHNWLDDLMADAGHEAASAGLRKDADAVRKYLGIGEDGKISRKQHEKWARSTERFFMEGVAPSKELAPVFAKFKRWLNEIYKTLDTLRAPINDEIRAVFDNLLVDTPDRQPAIIAGDIDMPEPPPLPAELKTLDAPPAAPAVAAKATPEAPPTAPPVQAPDAPAVAPEVPAEVPAADRPVAPSTVLPRADDGLVDKAGNIRLENLNTPEDVNAVMRQAAEEKDGFLRARGVVSDAQVMDLADAMGVDASEVSLRRISKNFGQGQLAAKIVAGRKLLIQSATSVRDAMAKAAIGDDAAVMAYAEAKARHLMIQESMSAVTAEAGRALRAFRELQGAEGGAEAQAVTDFLKSATGKDLFQLQQEARLGASLETPQQVSKFLKDSQKPKFTDMIIEYWINSLLSGPVTHVKNILANTLVAANSVVETAAAAGIGKIRGSADRVQLNEARARLFGMMQGAKEGLATAGRIIREEEVSSLASTNEKAHIQAIPGVAGRVIRTPTRLLGAEDEFFKAIGYRQELNELAARQANTETLTGDAFVTRVAQLTQSPSEEMMLAARKAAEYQTFTNSLGPTGRAIQNFANSHFLAKLAIPFIRTPTNILKFAAERSPFGLLSREVRNNLAGVNGTVMRDKQMARLAIGTSVGMAAMGLFLEGNITSGGPSDPKERAFLRTTGWQPYSVKVGDMYYSYEWLDPMATIMGTWADIAEVTREGMENDEDYIKMASMILTSTSKNLTRKLSLRGVSDLIQTISDPDRYGERYIQNFAAGFVPSLLGQTARAIDPTQHETQSLKEALQAKIPFASRYLLPKRDVWGEPIERQGNLGPDFMSPIYLSREKNDPVNNALINLGVFPSKPERKVRGVELDDTQYDDYSRIAGRLTKSRLNSLVTQPGFTQMPKAVQMKAIQKTVSSTRELARKAVMLKYPVLIQTALENKRRVMTEPAPPAKSQ